VGSVDLARSARPASPSPLPSSLSLSLSSSLSLLLLLLLLLLCGDTGGGADVLSQLLQTLELSRSARIKARWAVGFDRDRNGISRRGGLFACTMLL